MLTTPDSWCNCDCSLVIFFVLFRLNFIHSFFELELVHFLLFLIIIFLIILSSLLMFLEQKSLSFDLEVSSPCILNHLLIDKEMRRNSLIILV